MTFTDEKELIFEARQETADAWYSLSVRADYRCFLVLSGKGTMEGARAIVEMLDRAEIELGDDIPLILGAIDLSLLRGGPLRAQSVLGRWLLGHRHKFKRIAIFEGRPFEMKLGRLTMKVARFHKVGFFDRRDDALRWLDAG